MVANQTVSAQNTTLQGMGIMSICMLVLPIMDAIAKYMAVTMDMSPAQVTYYRFFFQLLSTLPLLLFISPKELFYAKRPWLNFLRGALHAAASFMFFAAVKYMPLADVFAIYFIEPFILTIMCAILLGDKVGLSRWMAIIVGFGGAMIVIQPSFEIFGCTSLLPAGCAFLFSLYLFLNRVLGDGDSPLVMQTMAGISGSLFMAMVLLIGTSLGDPDFAMSLPGWNHGLILLILLGSISGYMHLLVVKAFRLAPVSVLAPFQYFEIISGVALGYIFFADFPTPSKWLGIAIIVASGLFIIWQEQRSRPVKL